MSNISLLKQAVIFNEALIAGKAKDIYINKYISNDEFIVFDCVHKGSVIDNLKPKGLISFKTTDNKEYKGLIHSYQEMFFYKGCYTATLTLVNVGEVSNER